MLGLVLLQNVGDGKDRLTCSVMLTPCSPLISRGKRNCVALKPVARTIASAWTSRLDCVLTPVTVMHSMGSA
jgi:hypothetical protein